MYYHITIWTTMQLYATACNRSSGVCQKKYVSRTIGMQSVRRHLRNWNGDRHVRWSKNWLHLNIIKMFTRKIHTNMLSIYKHISSIVIRMWINWILHASVFCTIIMNILLKFFIFVELSKLYLRTDLVKSHIWQSRYWII